MIIHLIVGLIKKTLYKMSQYFPKPYEPFGGDINVTVDLSNYATKDATNYATNPKFKVGNHVRISKYKNIFAKGYSPNWSEEVFVINKIKNTVPWTYVINDLNGE